MRRTAAGLAAAAMLVLGACTITPSKVAADADVNVGGRVTHQDGRPAPGARVALTKHGDVGAALTAVFSLGLACLSEEFGDACRSARVTTAGADGRFDYSLKGRDTHGFLGDAATLELSTAVPRGKDEYEGAATSLTFLAQTTRVDLPLRAWEPKVAASRTGRVIKLDWDEVPPGLLPDVDPTRLTSHVRFERSGRLIWEFTDLDPGAEIDPRLLEDSRGSFSVAMKGSGFEVSEDLGTEIGVVLRSARVPYRSSSGKPASRGAACSVIAGGRSYAQPSCGLTDGNLHERFAAQTTTECPSDGCPPVQESIVDLGRTLPVSLVAVRGCASTCSAAVSGDARTWRAIGSRTQTFGSPEGFDAAFTLNRGIPARYVRVMTGGAGMLREVSVWDRAAPLVSVPSTIVARVEPGALPFGERAGAASSRLPLVAAILGGIALGALGMTLLRRRRPTS